MKRPSRSVALVLALLTASWTTPVAAQDLYMKDTPADTGVEPNPDTGPMWVTEDIWVRTNPDPSYQPYPFVAASPPWTPLPHENPEYRDPKFSTPNYVYVRVRNRGSSASTGTERLRLYWAKASTGLSWDTQWVDYLANNCGPTKLYGAEITKPRKNAALATVAERNAYRDAILDIGTLPAFVFFGGVSYWHKQDQVHSSPFGPANRHGTSAFLPWHREYINRYEALLQEADPLVKLLYWDWTTDPENSSGFNFFTSSFMGASGRGLGLTSIGAPFLPALSPPAVTRNLGVSTTPPANADATLLGVGVYPTFGFNLEQVPNHNSSHTYIGGGGNMSSVPTAAEDPFFFVLHANADRLWAKWQRNPAVLSRLDPATAYDGDSTNVNITTAMRPWNGAPTVLDPWTVAGGYIVSKTPQHPSVVSPPIYDNAPLVIPVLQPGEAVVIQIPWYPPNPADFSCFGPTDQKHFCLLGRIETSTTPPFGMTFAEGTSVGTNTRNNNNIAWKNVTVVDNFAGALKVASVLVRNVFREFVVTGLRFADAHGTGTSFFPYGRIFVDLKPELFNRWMAGGRVGQGIEPAGTAEAPGRIRIFSPDAFIGNLQLGPDEVYSVDVHFELAANYPPPPRGAQVQWDLVQTGTPDKPNAIVGGQRFTVDFDNLVLVKPGGVWRYLDGTVPTANWVSPNFNDSSWKLGGTPVNANLSPEKLTTYFRHSFEVADPEFFKSLLLRLKRDDGAVVYLNGNEVHRVNLPAGGVGPGTAATRAVDGLEEEVFFPVPVSPGLLLPGRNVIAVEVHQASANGEDVTFDLELTANRSSTEFAPDVAFAPPNGTLWQAGKDFPIDVAALDSDGEVKSVSLYADGRLIATLDKAPYRFVWQGAPLGSHRLRAVATDLSQQQGAAEITVTVVDNTPPVAVLTQPADNAVLPNGAVVASAQASDPQGGFVQRVEFHLMDGELFDAPIKVFTDTTAPYTVSLTGLAPGHYMLSAWAVDEKGARSQSLPVHFSVGGAHNEH